MDILKEAATVLKTEAEAILSVSHSINDSFLETISILKNIKGKIILSGIGKSGIIAKRIASMFSSTGSPAFFMHPIEGLHGDIGIVSKLDAVILITHSGNNSELLALIPYIKRHGVKIITITKSRSSTIAKFSDVTIETKVKKEACPFNLVPTTSSAVTSAIGDSLAITLLKIKGFKKGDYKNVHPGGDIGKRLLYRVEDLMVKEDNIPSIDSNQTLKDALHVMSRKKLGMTTILKKDKLSGIITDGDLRRLLETGKADLSLKVGSIKTTKPKTVLKSLLAVEALAIMEKHAITSLVVVNNRSQNRTVGVIHMHTILKSGVV